MKIFERMAQCVEDAWKKQDRHVDAFASAAAHALREIDARREIGPEDLLQHVRTADLPEQVPGENDFGNPALTVFRNARFRIELIFWGGPAGSLGTGIHEHVSPGAFYVLAGDRLQSEFRFEIEREPEPTLALGRLIPTKFAMLRAGDVQEILIGDKFIHGLFFVARKAASISIRLPKINPHGHVYWGPGLRLVRPDLTLQRRLMCLDFGRAMDPDAEADLSAELIAARDLSSTVFAFSRLRNRIPPKSYRRLIDKARSAHGDVVDRLAACVEYTRRQALIGQTLTAARDVHHVELMGLLWDGGLDRTALLDWVSKKPGVHDPIAAVLQWLDELNAQIVQGGGAMGRPAMGGPLGVPWTPQGRGAFERALRGEKLDGNAELSREVQEALPFDVVGS
jgi:hypothetical protein